MEQNAELTTVKVPPDLTDLFLQAQDWVSRYFQERSENPAEGTIEVFGQRYILVRGAALSVDLFEDMKERYGDAGEDEAVDMARSLLFDIAHTIGRTDARNVAGRLDLKDPIAKLSAGPVHFSHSGWAFVDISPESRPSPDADYYLLYDHPYSFEADAWMRAGKRADFPVCVMNAGYSSGWCSESFGLPLVAVEITCQARGDDHCRFIMGHADRLEAHIAAYREQHPELAAQIGRPHIPNLMRHRQVEQDLRRTRRENHRLALVAGCTRSAVLILDRAGRVEWANEGFRDLTGLHPQAVEGRSAADLLPVHNGQRGLDDWLDAVRDDAEGLRLDMHGTRADGSPLWLNVEIQPVLNEVRAPTGLVIMATDITKRKADEERHRQLVDELGAVNRELKDFAYVVSHDLKAPLRGIRTLADWIVEDAGASLSPESRENLDLLCGRVERMQRLIQGVLEYSRSGRHRIEPEPVDLPALLDEIVDSLAVPPHIRVHLDVTLPQVIGDRTTLTQVFQNLIGNAVKFMDKPEGRVAVTAEAADGGWTVRVTDNGPGIPPESHDRIFGIFQTLNPRDEIESTGVGLTVVKKLVEQAGGRITLESTVGEGTTFTVTLPAATPEPTPVATVG